MTELLAEEALDGHGDEDALDENTDNRLDSSDPGLSSVEAELHKEDTSMNGIEADLQSDVGP